MKRLIVQTKTPGALKKTRPAGDIDSDQMYCEGLGGGVGSAGTCNVPGVAEGGLNVTGCRSMGAVWHPNIGQWGECQSIVIPTAHEIRGYDIKARATRLPTAAEAAAYRAIQERGTPAAVMAVTTAEAAIETSVSAATQHNTATTPAAQTASLGADHTAENALRGAASQVAAVAATAAHTETPEVQAALPVVQAGIQTRLADLAPPSLSTTKIVIASGLTILVLGGLILWTRPRTRRNPSRRR